MYKNTLWISYIIESMYTKTMGNKIHFDPLFLPAVPQQLAIKFPILFQHTTVECADFYRVLCTVQCCLHHMSYCTPHCGTSLPNYSRLAHGLPGESVLAGHARGDFN